MQVSSLLWALFGWQDFKRIQIQMLVQIYAFGELVLSLSYLLVNGSSRSGRKNRHAPFLINFSGQYLKFDLNREVAAKLYRSNGS